LEIQARKIIGYTDVSYNAIECREVTGDIYPIINTVDKILYNKQYIKLDIIIS